MAPETSFSAILAPRNGSTAPRELFSTTPAKCGTSLFRVSPNGTVTVGTTVLDPVNGIYSPGLSIFGRQNLKRWDAAVANLTYNNSGAIVVAMIGDSWTCNGGYTWQLGLYLQTLFGNSGFGYINDDQNCSPDASNNGLTTTRVGTWTDTTSGATLGLNAAQATSSDTTTPASITTVGPNTTTNLVLHYALVPGGGSFTYSVDAAAATSIVTDANAVNFFQHSSNWSDWAVFNATPTVGAADPFGGSEAYTFTESIDGSAKGHEFQQAFTCISGTCNISVFAKAATRTQVFITDNYNGAYPSVIFDLSLGSVVAGGALTGSIANCTVPFACGPQFTPTVAASATGWFRLSATVPDTGVSHSRTIGIASAGSISYTGNGSGLYLFGPQLTVGPTPVAYEVYGAGTSQPAFWNISGLSSASHTLVRTVTVAGTSGVTLLGIEANNTPQGIRVERIGHPGAQASLYAGVNPAFWKAEIAQINPDLVILPFGINELLNNAAPAAQSSALTTIINNIWAADPTCAILLFPPPDPDRK